jgi:hypothetical protein
MISIVSTCALFSIGVAIYEKFGKFDICHVDPSREHGCDQLVDKMVDLTSQCIREENKTLATSPVNAPAALPSFTEPSSVGSPNVLIAGAVFSAVAFLAGCAFFVRKKSTDKQNNADLTRNME